MMSKTLTDHIIDTIKAEANNNPAPQRCRITRVYSDGNHVDVLTDEGKIEYVDAIGSNFIEGNNAVILFFDEEFQDYVVIADSDLSDYIMKSSITGLVKNDGSIDTTQYLSQHQDISNYIQKSQTSGLIKNDGTVDTTQYLSSHQDITGKCDKTNGANQLTDSSAYSNLGTSSNATQKQINNAINTKIGAILTILGNCEDLLGE